MRNTSLHDDARTDDDHREASPSTGAEETAAIMHTEYGLGECDAPECDRDGERVRVIGPERDVRREGVRCGTHRKGFLEVSS